MNEVIILGIALIFGAVMLLQQRSHDKAEAEWRSERADLLQRIQAPAQAVVSHAIDETKPLVQAVPFDDDDAANEASEARRVGN